MAKVVKLKRSDLIRIVENTLNILPNQNDLPKHFAELEKLVSEGKRMINRMYNFVMDLSLREILEDSGKYDKLLQDIENTKDAYSNKHDQFHDIIESHWDAYINDEMDRETADIYNRYNNTLNELYVLSDDMYTLYKLFEEMHFNANRTGLLKDFTDTYPNQTINIDKSLNISKNEN